MSKLKILSFSIILLFQFIYPFSSFDIENDPVLVLHSDTRLHIDSLTVSTISHGMHNFSYESAPIYLELTQPLFYLKGVEFTGVVYDSYPSGGLKFEWDILNGKNDGKAIGYHDLHYEVSDPMFEYSYVYSYSNGIKTGDQFEFFLKDEIINNYNYPKFEGDIPYENISQYIPGYDDIAEQDTISKLIRGFGNRDSNRPIIFHGSEAPETGCIYSRSWDGVRRANCPTGELIVYYEAQPDLLPNAGYTVCIMMYGNPYSFWRLYGYHDGKWWFQ